MCKYSVLPHAACERYDEHKEGNFMPHIKIVKAIVALLVVQFLLGVLASLYQEVPSERPWEVFEQFGFISVHAVNGTLLLVLGMVFLYQAVKRKTYKREAISGLGAIVAAYAFGEAFVFTQNDLMSFLMAGSFIGALFSYVRVMYVMQPGQNK